MAHCAPRTHPCVVLGLGTAVIVAGALLVAPIPVAAQTATSPDSPGSVALLAGKLDKGSIDALARAIGSETPLVRAVAARTAAVSDVASLADSIATAFESERDATAAVEQARALLFLRGQDATASIDRRLASLPEVATPYGEWLARRRPERLAALLERVPAEAVPALLPAAKAVVSGRSELAERLLRAWLAVGPATTWKAVLEGADATSPGVAAAMAHALGAESERIREETVWALADRVANHRSVPASLQAAVAVPIASAAPGIGVPPTWERLGREMIGRGNGLKTPDRTALIRSEGRRRQQDLGVLWLFDTLTRSERSAVKDLLAGRPPERRAAADRATEKDIDVAMRTVPVVWPGFVSAVMDAAGCSPADAQAAVVSVRYWADGRVADLRRQDQQLPAPCATAATALAALTLHDIEHGPPPGEPEVLVLPLDQDYVVCASAPESVPSPLTLRRLSDARLESSAKIKPPERKRHVAPTYPKPLQDRGVEGTVLVEAIITAAGCVSAQRVTRSPHLLFGLTSLRAISAWRFAPALLNGEPVPAIMTMTVRFALH